MSDKSKIVNLGDLLKFKNGKRYDGQPGNFPIYGSNGVIGSATRYNAESVFIIGRVGTCGAVHYEKDKCWVSDNAIICEQKTNADTQYLYQILKSRRLDKLHVGSSQPLMTKGILSAVLLELPSLQEQKRIASTLSAVDKAIEQAGIAIEESKRIKRGLMQKLMNNPNWISKKMEEIAPLQRGFDLPSSDVKPGEYPVVYSNGILATHNEYKCDGYGVVTGRSGSIGKFIFIDNKKYWPHNTTLWVTNFCGNDPKFIYYFYQSLNIEKFSSGTSVPTLDRKNIHKQVVKIPESIEEQKEIVKILELADEYVLRTNRRKSLLETLKRGMMQQLLAGAK